MPLTELVSNKSFCKEVFIVRFLFERQTQPAPAPSIIPDSSALTDNVHRIPENAPAVSQCPLCPGERGAGTQGQPGSQDSLHLPAIYIYIFKEYLLKGFVRSSASANVF